ncbi:MAG TPA: DegQ family serine endoprotease [Candidatus Acidoferrales bacterium]|jgi:serine protease Do|nr:DegQ family serine endoprotease [Candidatus Acidoferrales bacterium]
MSSTEFHVRRWVATVVVLAAIIGGVALDVGLRHWSGRTVFGAPALALNIAHDDKPVVLGSMENGFASVLKPVLPAVVNISTSKVVKNKPDEGMFNDPFFRQFFGNQFGNQMQPRSEREHSLGSGVIVTSDGTIITNNHVIDGATDIQVYLSDNRQFAAKLIGTDPKTDVAVIKINATGLPTLPIGDSSKMQVGDVVLAIGDPFGIGKTATAGIVSATGRGGLGIENYEDFIQTDASINPGNSGGALINLHGSLIGINTAILSGQGGGNQGIGFAIPINLARNVMNQLVEHGKVTRGYLGVHIQDVTPALAKQFGLNQGGGVLIGDVSPDTPAAKAGLKSGDVITELNGQPVEAANQLQVQIAEMAPGSTVKMKVWRDGKSQDMNVTLGELPEKAEATEPGQSSEGALEGVDVQNLTPDVAQQLDIPATTKGVVVTQVDPSSPASSSGLDRGMVIQEVNHKPVTNISQYKQALTGMNSQSVLLLVNQGGVTRYIVVETR